MPETREVENQTRRSFLLLVPLGLLAGVFSSLAVAGFRLLRPRITSTASENWIDVASLTDLRSGVPLSKKIATDHLNGWALSREQHQIYVLPDNRVLSAQCPHEGCEVAWDNASNRFLCPCHESYFAGDGTRLNGPARRGLDVLPSRVKDGVLQVQYASYENNSAEPIKRS